LPESAIISVTRGEKFNIVRLIINGIINEFVKKQLTRDENLLYAELSGELQGGIGQTVTIWKDGSSMNKFSTKGAHKFAKQIPTDKEIEETIKKYGRHFD
jgi:hypothetical protein